MSSYNLWKPMSEKGALVILFTEPAGQVIMRDADTGQIIEQGVDSGPSNERASTVRFSRPGSAYNNVIIETGSGESFYIENGAARIEGFELSPPGQVPTTVTGRHNPGGHGDMTGGMGPGMGGLGGFGGLGPGIPGVAAPMLLDPTFIQPFPIPGNPINFNTIEGEQAEFIDPLETTRETAAFNLEQDEQNFATGLNRARALQKAELASIQEFAQQMAGTQQDIVADENTFNQQQRLQAADVAIPGIQETFADQRERAETLASGRMLSSAEDRALELTARSASADGSFVRGFGDDSVVGRRQSDILSAQQRLNLSQMGENLLTRSIQQAQGLLFDTPLKANISQRLPSQPNVPLAQLASQQQTNLNRISTMDPATVLQSRTQQEQFNTNLGQRTQEFNAQGTFQADQFNSNDAFRANQFNSNQAYQARLAQLGIMASNAAAIQGFQQNVFNAAAAGEQQSRRTELNEEQQARLDEVRSDYNRTRDRNQLIRDVAGILELGINSELVQDIVAEIIGEEDAGTDIDTDVGGGSRQPDTPVVDDDLVDDDIPQSRPGDSDRITTEPDEIPEGNVGIQSNPDGTVDSIPEEEFADEPADDLMSTDGEVLRTTSLRIRPFSSESLAFDSGADLTLSPELRRELGGMI